MSHCFTGIIEQSQNPDKEAAANATQCSQPATKSEFQLETFRKKLFLGSLPLTQRWSNFHMQEK